MRTAMAFIYVLLAFSWCRAAESVSWYADKISVSTTMGLNRSSIVSDGDLHYYFEPLPAVKHNTGYDWGLELDIKMARYFFLCTGMRYEAGLGQYTEAAEVAFEGAPGIHDFESYTDLKYFSVPLNIKLGYDYRNHWLYARLGPVASRVIGSKSAWRVDNVDADGSVISGMPEVHINSWDTGMVMSFLFGMEYGYRIDANGIFLAVNYQRGLDSFATANVSGEAFMRGWSYAIGFRKFF